jgi:N-succinyldiaminopimelate aminotransferase
MTEQAGVTAVPVSAFYIQNEGQDGAASVPRNFVRFCFSKQDHILDAAIERLSDWFAA